MISNYSHDFYTLYSNILVSGEFVSEKHNKSGIILIKNEEYAVAIKIISF